MKAFDELKKKLSEDATSFIVVLGAGASVPAGLPTWRDLKYRLCDTLSDSIPDPKDRESTLNYIDSSPDLWVAFSRLKSKLGRATYEREIINALNPPNLHIPALYKQLWKLNIAGIIDFNVDRLALDSHSEVLKKHVDFATGKEPHKYANFPLSHNKFVFHPHGIITDSSSWIFEDKARYDLYCEQDFKEIITTLLNCKNLLIIGFNMEEWSFKQLLRDCSINQRLNGYNNYYFLPNATSDTMRDYEEIGVSVIPYNPATDMHYELNGYLDDILNYNSTDIPQATIYNGKMYSEEDIPSEEESHSVSLEELRDILNGVVANIIPPSKTPSEGQLEALKRFYDTYVTQLHRAWLVDVRTPKTNTVYGYKVLNVIGSGAFGTVYEAEDSNGDRYALKVLLPEVKDKTSYLSCFRRGIRSMKILKEKDVAGMVSIHNSYEVPACIVMDMVYGVTLREAIDNHYLTRLEVKLVLLARTAEIIHSAHQLEERILHRDIKPENIILRGCYSEQDFESIECESSVTVLDFDLSWHRGAVGKTIEFGGITQGFMAPEQLDMEEDKSLARSTSVDVYSLGMLTYFVLTGRNPVPNEPQFAIFPSRLLAKLKETYGRPWKCLPKYLCETIQAATDSNVLSRISLDGLISNLRTALSMYLYDDLPNTHPLVLLEMKEYLSPCDRETISDFGRHIYLEYPEVSKEITIYTISHNSHVALKVDVKRYASSSVPRDSRLKYFKGFGEKAVACASDKYFGIKKYESSLDDVTVHLTAYLPPTISLEYIKGITDNVIKVRGQLGT